MAKLSPDKKSVIVEKGDTLQQIAIDYAGGYSKYKMLAAINNIPDPTRIYIGQVIKLTKDESGENKRKLANDNKPIVTLFGLQSNAENLLFAVWEWSKFQDHTESYKVAWTYDTGDGIWWNGSSSTISNDKDDPWLVMQSTFTIPNNATRVQFRVKPISETYKKDDVDTNYWEALWSDYSTYVVVPINIETPQTPSVEIDIFKLTASLTNINIANASHIEFQVLKDTKIFTTKKIAIVNQSATFVTNITAGGEYKVRCRAYSLNYNLYSTAGENNGWSDWSDGQKTIPQPPKEIISIRALSDTNVKLTWQKVPTATSYTIQYTTNKAYFDTSNEPKSQTVEDVNVAIITGLESGKEYFFRLRATNSVGDSAWTGIKSIKIGKPPAAPTTWSSTTTAIVGDAVILYWVHNSEDGSSQTESDLEIYKGDDKEPFIKETGRIDESNASEDSENKISEWTLLTDKYTGLTDGTSLRWRIRTAGITGDFGDWSVERPINIYAPPTLELEMTEWDGQPTNILHSYPFHILASAGPINQTPVGYHLSIKSNQIYETIDNLGKEKIVNKDEEVYSQFFDTTVKLLSVEFTPANISLMNDMEYTVVCTVSMNSGLTAEASLVFDASWRDHSEYAPNAEIGVDNDTMTASIRPYCENTEIVYYQVIIKAGKYTKTTTELYNVYGSIIRGMKTTTGEQVYSGVNEDGTEVYYCIVEEKTPVEYLMLSVYRREFDGSFTEIATKLSSADSTTVIDPHPALDYARYRIIGTNILNGSITYYDTPGYPIGGKAVIIQWDEDWTSFETSEEGAMEQPPWSGSLLELPYNIDVSENNKPDISLIEYIGRDHPVSYYGTQLGSTATWSLVIPKEDKETLYGLRRLAKWMGDVYVREPSGSGYWANITVSFSQKHCEVTIPVTLNISRVEGGI